MMLLLTALFFLGLESLLVAAQVTFLQPVANQVIAGGVSFLVTCSDSKSAPYFSQMSNFSMLLFAGSYVSPKVLYAWDLDSMNPSTVQNSIIIPRTIGPSAASSYFFGMSGWLSLNSSISVTYFSSKFTLQNMTGPASNIPTSSSTSAYPTATAVTGRLVLCEDSAGDFTVGENGLGVVVSRECELAALAVISLLTSTTSASITRTSLSSSVTATPLAMSDYSTQIAVVSTSATSTGSPNASGTSAVGAQATVSSAANGSGTATSRQGAKMVYCLVIAGLVLATIIALFWIWRRYSNKNISTYCDHLDCEHSNFRKRCDMVLRPRVGTGMNTKVSTGRGDAEKGSISGVSVERTVSVDVEISPVTSRAVINPRAFEREREREAEAEAAAVVAALASKAAAVRRQRFEEAMGNRASRRASRRTIVAELEGDLGAGAEAMPTPPIPVDLDRDERRDTFPDLGIAKRKTIVGQGQQGTVVKGRDAAVIVRVGSGRKPHASSSSRVIEGADLPPIPVHRTEDDEDANYILQVLYVKGDNDETDDEIDAASRRREEARNKPGHEEDIHLEAEAEESRADERRIRDLRKKKMRHKRNQLSAESQKDIASAVAGVDV